MSLNKYMLKTAENEEEISLMNDLIDYYARKGYLTSEDVNELKAWHKIMESNPFEYEVGLFPLCEGLKRAGHQIHAISHKFVDKQKLERIWNKVFREA